MASASTPSDGAFGASGFSAYQIGFNVLMKAGINEACSALPASSNDWSVATRLAKRRLRHSSEFGWSSLALCLDLPLSHDAIVSHRI